MINKDIHSYIDNLILILLGLFLISLPLFFLSSFSDPFIFPKQILLAFIVLISLLLFGVKIIMDQKIVIRSTPFNIPLLVFAVTAVLSSLFSLNRAESVISVFPLVFSILLYFIITNFVKNKKTFSYMLYNLILGGFALFIISIFSKFNVYLLTSPLAKIQNFSTFGSILDEALYLTLLLPVAIIVLIKTVSQLKGKKENPALSAFLIISSLAILGSFFLSAINIISQKPLILPFKDGFQIAFASVSQDSGRILQSILFGSGFGTFFSDFTRFKLATFNLDASLWNLQFGRSSSFILELLATTGFLGLASFVFILLRGIKEVKDSLGAKKWTDKIFPIPFALVLILSLLLPFSFSIYTFLFILLALYSVEKGLANHEKYFDLEIYSVAFKSDKEKTYLKKLLPITFFGMQTIFVLSVSYFLLRYTTSELMFQNSFVQAQQNNGQKLYELQNEGIKNFPYKDSYYRIFSQTNLALANSLANQQPKGQQPNQKTKETIYSLIQNSINSARTAVAISPLSSLNWQNLSSVYRNLIGFGQNAESFAVLTAQQAILLDPNNPQEYINLGGIYYQLGQWDNAERQFQVAVNLKPDFANAYYNLGHALENKQNLQGALAQYETVKRLVANDKENVKKITAEIASLQEKINAPKKEEVEKETPKKEAKETKESLEISTPSATLPKQEPPVEIPGPTESSPTPTPQEETTPQPNL